MTVDDQLPGAANALNSKLGAPQSRGYSFGSKVLWALTPDILARKPPNTRRAGPTAFLDGLRGVAAFCVCMMHLTVYTHSNIERCYGTEVAADGTLNVSPLAWPIVRAIFLGGHFAVMLFFIISGYVLPRRMLSLIHEGPSRRGEFVDAVTSAIFRRPGRLFLPVIGSTFVMIIFWHATGIKTNFPLHQPTFISELIYWWHDQLKFVFVFRGGHYLFTHYNGHTWTIPIELRGSMFIWVWLFALHQVRTRKRILITLGMVIYLACGAAGGWYAAFFAGMLTSELDLLSANDHMAQGTKVILPWDSLRNWLRRNRGIKQLIMHVFLVCGLFLASQPASDSQSREKTLDCPAFRTLANFIPNSYMEYDLDYRWFWIFWAAWFTLIGIKEIDWIKALFESNFALYLGKHSFALYLVHGPMIAIFADRLFYLTGVHQPYDMDAFGWMYKKWDISNAGPWGLEINFLTCVAISLPVFLYVAEVVTRTLDEPSVRFSKWLHNKARG